MAPGASRSLVPYFEARGHRALTLDLPGHGAGASRGAALRLGLDACVDSVQRAYLSITPRPVLIGHSLGALLVQRILAQEGSVPGAVLMAPLTPRAILAQALSVLGRHPGASLRAVLTWSPQALYHDERFIRRFFFGDEVPAAELERYRAHITGTSYSTSALARILSVRIPPPRRPETPVLVLGGGRDPTSTPRVIERVARRYAATAAVIADAPHDLMLGAAWQEGADRILRWLTERAP